MDDLSGLVVTARYTIERELGRGGMAVVWLARDAQHGRRVAIKTLHPDLVGAAGVDRFVRETRLTARLQHPGIVPILDSGVLDRPDGTRIPWYAMPLLEGESLRARLGRERQLSIDDSLRITDAVGRALTAAHEQHVVHRDIKPENVFLAGEQVYVLDFGIAKAVAGDDNEGVTSTGFAIGTPTYMSPEQALAGTVDARSDQYALACILYEMLAGEPPFAGPNPQAIIARRLVEPARPLSTVRRTVPPSVERATLRALERAPADRFPDIPAFLAALKGSGPAYHAGPARYRRFATAALIPMAIVAVGLAAWVVNGRDGAAPAHAVRPDVVALYQRGVRAYDRRTQESVAEAIVTLRAALERDSSYAPAWNALAKAFVRAHQRGFAVSEVPAGELVSLAVNAVDRSLSLDSTSADAWMTHAIVSQQVDPTDIAPALRSMRRSLALDSTQAPAWHFYALYMAESGDLAAGLDGWRKAVRSAPAYSQGVAFLALGHQWRLDLDSAAFWADSAIALDPTYLLARNAAASIAVERGEFARAEREFDAQRRLSTGVDVANALAGLALVQARSGRPVDARAILRRVDSIAHLHEPVPLHTAVGIAQVHAALDDMDAMFAALRSYAPLLDVHLQLHLRCDPAFVPLRGDPRFRALLVSAPPDGRQGCR